MAKIAINGFGRIGRLFFRAAFNNPDLNIVAINDLGDKDNLLYLLKYDSVYGRYDPLAGGAEKINEVKFLQEKEPAKLPWKDLGIDIVIESTGVFESYAEAKVHLASGAKRVLISAPAKDEDGANGKTILMGVNEEDLKTCQISSNGSCTTNSAHSVIQVLQEKLGIKKAMLSTIHAVTATQNLVDGPTKGKDFRRGRCLQPPAQPHRLLGRLKICKVNLTVWRIECRWLPVRFPILLL